MRILPFVLLLALAPATGAPSLHVDRLAPLTVSGRGFEPRERVAVRVAIGGRIVATRRTVAAAGGGFRIRFSPFLATDPCRRTIVVTARGSAGSRATVRRACRPADPQP